MKKTLVTVLLLSLLALGFSIVPGRRPAASSNSQPPCELVVLSDPADAYYPLAEEIGAVENAVVLHDLQEVFDCQPTYVLWVVSPGGLSEAVMMAFGQAVKKQPAAFSTGIITASTLEGARELWQRRTQVQGRIFFTANAANPSALIDEGRIRVVDEEPTKTLPLTKANFLDALQAADYLTFTGHGGSTYLKLDDEGTKITADELPRLDALVIGTGSCQTLRPWKAESIAVGFVDLGAAAYAGFVFSPNEGYLMGEFNELPFRYTWPDFPIGHVIQAQNQGTLQGFAQFPYLFLLGDPRTALQTEPPYRLVNDLQEGDWRVLEFQDVPAGVIPIRVPGGAAYDFVKVPHGPAASEGDPFYNSKLQMITIQQHKFILMVHEGGDLRLALRERVPWYWYPGDIVLDSLDHTLIFSQQSGGDVMSILIAIIPLTWAGWQGFKKRISRVVMRMALFVGLGAAVLQGGYVGLRLDEITIISKAVELSPLSLVASFILTAGGALIYFQARSKVGKLVALLVITSSSWVPVVLGLGMIAGFNLLVAMPEMGASLYNYAIGLLPAGGFGFTFTLDGIVLWYLDRWVKRGTVQVCSEPKQTAG